MIFMPFGSILVQRNYNPRLLIVLAGSVAFPCFVISTFMSSFSAFAVFYILGFSFNHGMSYMVPVHHGWLWFPGNPGLISGIIIGGFGFGPLIFDNVFTHMINPDNLPIDEATGFYPDEVNERFEKTWRTCIVSWFVLVVIGCAMIFPGPVKKK